MIVAGTGHRPDKLGGYDEKNDGTREKVKESLRQWFEDKLMFDVKHPSDLVVISGMAQGYDTWLAQVALDLRLPLVAIVPWVGFELRWLEPSKAEYVRILSAASKVSFCSAQLPANKDVARFWLGERNRQMVDAANIILACWNGSLGGTCNTVGYAWQQRKLVHYLPIPSMPRDHHCHAKGCKAPCRPEKLMCALHWAMVPYDLQRAVYAAYVPGQCELSPRPSKEWHAAADAAILAVAQREGVTR